MNKIELLHNVPAFSRLDGDQLALLIALALLAAVAMAWPVSAQSTGMCKGKVVDRDGNPVEGAKITIAFKDGISRSYEVKTNKKGEYMQVGLSPGHYRVTARLPARSAIAAKGLLLLVATRSNPRGSASILSP